MTITASADPGAASSVVMAAGPPGQGVSAGAGVSMISPHTVGTQSTEVLVLREEEATGQLIGGAKVWLHLLFRDQSDSESVLPPHTGLKKALILGAAFVLACSHRPCLTA